MRQLLQKALTFMPTWRFFVEPEPKIYLLMRHGSTAELNTEWIDVIPAIQPSWLGTVYNPDVNFYHAQNTWVRRLVDMINSTHVKSSKEITRSPQYSLIHRLVLYSLVQNLEARESTHYQFAISLSRNNIAENSVDLALLSRVYERPT